MEKTIQILSFALLVLLIASCGDDTPNDKNFPTLLIENASIDEMHEEHTFEFVISLSEVVDSDLRVEVRTSDGTAESGVDFQGVNTVLVIEAGSSQGVVPLVIYGDSIQEEDEFFLVNLSNPVNAELRESSAIITLVNDDFRELVIPETGYETPTSYEGMTLVWADEFEGTNLNMNNWSFDLGNGCPNLCGWGNNELEFYTDQNHSFVDGNLIMEAREESQGGFDYTSIKILTRDKQTFKYGRIDIRAVLPFGQGIWPALWMLPAEEKFGGWAASGEIDIMELVGHDPEIVHGTIHYGGSWPDNLQSGIDYRLSSGIFADEFHVFTLIWEEDKLEWYVDDVLYFSRTPTDIAGSNWPFNEEFFLIFNIAVGGNWPGSPNNTTVFPQWMVIDYIRVFQENN